MRRLGRPISEACRLRPLLSSCKNRSQLGQAVCVRALIRVAILCPLFWSRRLHDDSTLLSAVCRVRRRCLTAEQACEGDDTLWQTSMLTLSSLLGATRSENYHVYDRQPSRVTPTRSHACYIHDATCRLRFLGIMSGCSVRERCHSPRCSCYSRDDASLCFRANGSRNSRTVANRARTN